MTREEVLDEVNVIYERISNYERYKDKNNLFSGRNYTEALEILIDYYEFGFIEDLKKIKAEIEELEYYDFDCNLVLPAWKVYDIIDSYIEELKGGMTYGRETYVR